MDVKTRCRGVRKILIFTSKYGDLLVNIKMHFYMLFWQPLEWVVLTLPERLKNTIQCPFKDVDSAEHLKPQSH